MTTALIIPFGAADTENGRARQAIWNRCYQLWRDGMEQGWHVDGHHLIVAGDPLFGQPSFNAPAPAQSNVGATHPFSVARAVNRAVRLAPPEVDRFVTIGADALPDWRVVDWAAVELETRPWTLLFGKGGNVDERGTEHFVDDRCGCFRDYVEHVEALSGVQPFETPCVGPIGFTRDAFLAVRGFDERFEGWAYEDVDLWTRLRTIFHGGDTGLRTSPYPLIQFSHPTDHHDLTYDNPNVRLWLQKSGHPLRNDHPAPNLFGADA